MDNSHPGIKPPKLLPMTPKYDTSVDTNQNNTPETPPLPPSDQNTAPDSATENLRIERQATNILGDEALNLLNQYSQKAKSDCLNLVNALSTKEVKEDDIIDGKIEVNENLTPAQKQNISVLAKQVAGDMADMQTITASASLPNKQLPNEKDFWSRNWSVTKNNAGAAALNSADLVGACDKLGSTPDSVGKFKDDAINAFQEINDAQGGITHLLAAGRINWQARWQQIANKDVISPLSKVDQATQELLAASQNLDLAAHVDISTFGTAARMLPRLAMMGAGGGAGGLAIGGAMGLGAMAFQGFQAWRAHNAANKVGNQSLEQIKVCIQSFRDADAECNDYLKKDAAKDPAFVQEITHLEGELAQVKPQIDDLEKMAGSKKHASWKNLNNAIFNLTHDDRIIQLANESRAVLDQIENSAGGR